MNSFWVAADMNQVNVDSNYKKQLAYGKALIAHTANLFRTQRKCDA
jgi:hypothetical protein